VVAEHGRHYCACATHLGKSTWPHRPPNQAPRPATPIQAQGLRVKIVAAAQGGGPGSWRSTGGRQHHRQLSPQYHSTSQSGATAMHQFVHTRPSKAAFSCTAPPLVRFACPLPSGTARARTRWTRKIGLKIAFPAPKEALSHRVNLSGACTQTTRGISVRQAHDTSNDAPYWFRSCIFVCKHTQRNSLLTDRYYARSR